MNQRASLNVVLARLLSTHAAKSRISRDREHSLPKKRNWKGGAETCPLEV